MNEVSLGKFSGISRIIKRFVVKKFFDSIRIFEGFDCCGLPLLDAMKLIGK